MILNSKVKTKVKVSAKIFQGPAVDKSSGKRSVLTQRNGGIKNPLIYEGVLLSPRPTPRGQLEGGGGGGMIAGF